MTLATPEPVADTVTLSTPEFEELSAQIELLKVKVTETLPGYELLLMQIHKILKRDETLAHLLTPEQVGVVVSGLMKKKNIVIVSSKSKANTKSLKNVTEDDI